MEERILRAKEYSKRCAIKRKRAERIKTSYVQRFFACSCLFLVVTLVAAVVVLA